MAIIKAITKFRDKLKSANSELKKSASKSREWLKKNLGKAFDTKSKDPKNWVHKDLKGQDKEFKQSISPTSRLLVGHLGFFSYDAKHKKTLPYWDSFPLIVMVGPASNGFMGLNFHYLPYLLRAKLFDDLLSIKKHTIHLGKKDDYFHQMSYDYLRGISQSKLVKPTIKHYLWKHVKSNFAHVHSEFWEEALFLPVEQFQKANKREVWKDSRDMV